MEKGQALTVPHPARDENPPTSHPHRGFGSPSLQPLWSHSGPGSPSSSPHTRALFRAGAFPPPSCRAGEPAVGCSAPLTSMCKEGVRAGIVTAFNRTRIDTSFKTILVLPLLFLEEGGGNFLHIPVGKRGTFLGSPVFSVYFHKDFKAW